MSQVCPGCGAAFPEISGPVHRYMESSPACWQTFGKILEREYSSPLLAHVHRLTVDAYAAQHPGQPSPQSMKSVGVHLIRLCLNLERGFDVRNSNKIMLHASKVKHRFEWLEPPTVKGELTVADVLLATGTEEHASLVGRWASSVWEAWNEHHPIVRKWADDLFLKGE